VSATRPPARTGDRDEDRLGCSITDKFTVDGPRPVREIRDALVEMAREAWEAGRVVDPVRLSELAAELEWAVAIVTVYGGDATTTARFADAVDETAQLARLTRRAVSA